MLIPISNVKELVLSEEVVDAVKEGQFHIYPITHICEGIELLMQTHAGEKDGSGEFPEDTVHGKAFAKLKTVADLSRVSDGVRKEIPQGNRVALGDRIT